MALVLGFLGAREAAARMHMARTPTKCGRVWLQVAFAHRGGKVAAPLGCPQLTMPPRYGALPTERSNEAAVVNATTGKLVAILLSPPQVTAQSPPPPHHFATERWHRAGVEFVSVIFDSGPRPDSEREYIR